MSPKKFKDFLLSLTKNELTKIRKHWQFGGISQLNKTELAAALNKRIKANLKSWLACLNTRNINFLEIVIERQKNNKRVDVNYNEITGSGLYNFYDRGIIDLIDSDTETSVRIPEDLAEEIEKIKAESDFKEQIKHNEELITFVRGLLVYYGALRSNQISKFFGQYYKKDKNETAAFLHMLKVVDEAYRSTHFIERYDYYYLDPGVLNPEEIIEEIEMRASIDHYQPRKKDILYAGTNEQERLNSVQRKFKKKLSRYFSISAKRADSILWKMMKDIKNDLNSMAVMQNLTDQYEFESQKQAQEFVQELNKLHNNTRMWVLKGHTPTDIFEEQKSSPSEQEEQDGSVGSQTVVKGEKVGRNDPCPCGSGEKYKKCCLGK